MFIYVSQNKQRTHYFFYWQKSIFVIKFITIMDFYDFLMDKAKKDNVQKIVVGGIVLNDKREILVMTRKPDDFLGGIDELPSGHLEVNETILQGMKREIKEETGMDILRIESYLDYFDYQSSSGKKTRQFNFVIIPKESKTVELTEHTAYKWQTPIQAIANTKITDEVKTCIQIFKANEFYKQSTTCC